MSNIINSFAEIIKNIIPDKIYLEYVYRLNTGKRLNLREPKLFGEKLQWLKLYDRKDYYTTLVDKQAVKAWVGSKIGEEYVIPTIKIWDSADEIEFDSLPNKFVMKCTHDCGSSVICENKEDLDVNIIKQHFKRCLKRDLYKAGREWPYKNVPRKIIVEELLENPEGGRLIDYKIQCFDGEPFMLLLLQKRGTPDFTCDFYDNNLKLIEDMSQEGLGTGGKALEIEKIDLVKKAFQLSKILSQGLIEIRVDWYIANDKLYFGEMTFFDSGRFAPYHPDKYERLLGDHIILPI